ncbi:hypothetical protein [Fibrella aquatilis]|uniref:Uncharacterized protein n=1 Tax=Fibrella aquatilis TaxID=2817059 RepID=A0A939G8E3_9BACT|nr:hypothetical protein [Fibrella aquatilis]MBO0933118.1 hypothetical protein [Fibrella aquatilis]
MPFEGRSTTAWVSNRTTLSRDLASANLVSEAADRLREKMSVSGAITLLGSDFNSFASPGKSQLTYLSRSTSVTFDMVIGNANAVNAQVWTLPADLTTQLDRVSRADFVAVGSIPASLSIAGVTHVSKYIAGNRQYVQFSQYQLKSNELQYLGYAVDRKIGTDFAQGSPDLNSSFATVPLTLGSTYTDIEVAEDPADDTKYENTSVITFDGFGTLNTPNGSFQALRYTMNTTGKTYDVSDPNNPVQIDTDSGTQVGWVTKEGNWIVANYTDYNATTKAATLSNVRYSAIVPTSSLSPMFTNPSCNCPR